MTCRIITAALLITATTVTISAPASSKPAEQRGLNKIDRRADNGGQTVLASRSIRLYMTRDRLGNETVRVCWVQTGKVTPLRTSFKRVLDLVPHQRIAGRCLGYAAIRNADPGVTLSVFVWDVKRQDAASFGAQPSSSLQSGRGTPMASPE